MLTCYCSCRKGASTITIHTPRPLAKISRHIASCEHCGYKICVLFERIIILCIHHTHNMTYTYVLLYFSSWSYYYIQRHNFKHATSMVIQNLNNSRNNSLSLPLISLIFLSILTRRFVYDGIKICILD